MDELKPCPFCGEPAEIKRFAGIRVSIRCSDRACGVAPRLAFTEDEALALWNTRPAPSPADAGLVERFRRALIALRDSQQPVGDDDAMLVYFPALSDTLLIGHEAAARIEALSGEYERGVEKIEEAGNEAYRQGYRDGFVDARFPEGHPGDERETWRDIDSVAIADGWQNYRDTFIRTLKAGAPNEENDHA